MDLLQATAQERRVAAPDLGSDAASQYLDQLQSLPLKSLLAEASAISADAGSVEGELTNLCFREYPTFISVHKCSAAVTSAFDDFSSSLGNLLDAVPALEDECRTFVRSTTGVQNARAKAALVQEHQDKLFDLLEIPQLMDTCVRNGYYQEALELSAHTESLLKRYPDVELVQDVAKEVDGVLQLMLAQLLALLREPIKLPALVKTVGYLRRLHIIDEEELGLAFLISRLSNFRTQLAGLERDRADPVRYVRKYVDLFREHVFDIISQFTAIFLEGRSTDAAASQLASFVGQCVDDLVALVAAYVPLMNDAASLSSILVQLGYCSLAFARVGLDFSALVTDPFSDAVQLAFSQTIEDATKSLTSTLAQAEKAAGSPAQALLAPEALSSLLSADTPLGFVTWNGSLEQLPTDLARFPPLAILVNAHLTALNSLRLLAPLHLHPRLAAAQSSALEACTHSIAKYVRQAVALSDPLSGTDKGHGRTSSGRAHLIRRNSETQMTPEARAARRKELQRTCVAFADVWGSVVVPLLRQALDRGVFEAEEEMAPGLGETLDSLAAWVQDQSEGGSHSPVRNGALGSARGTPNGSGTHTPMTAHAEDHAEEVFGGYRLGSATKDAETAGAGTDAGTKAVAEAEADAEAKVLAEAEAEADAAAAAEPGAEAEAPKSDDEAALTVAPPEPVLETPDVQTPALLDTPAVQTPALADTPAVDTPSLVATPALDDPVASEPALPSTAAVEASETKAEAAAEEQPAKSEVEAEAEAPTVSASNGDADGKPDPEPQATSAESEPEPTPAEATEQATAETGLSAPEPKSAVDESSDAAELEPSAAAEPAPAPAEPVAAEAEAEDAVPEASSEHAKAAADNTTAEAVPESTSEKPASPVPSPDEHMRSAAADEPAAPSTSETTAKPAESSAVADEPTASTPAVPSAVADEMDDKSSTTAPALDKSEATPEATTEAMPEAPAETKAEAKNTVEGDATPALEDDDDAAQSTPAPSTGPSRAPSPTGAPSTSGGGKKKKKKNKKKK